MPRPCTVCSHAERSTIDQQLVGGASYRAIADSHGVSKSALLRHQQHQEPQVVTDNVSVTGHMPGQAPAQHQCPCESVNWHELAHDAQQLGTYLQQAQTQDEALHYMKFYLLRFAALIASACAQPRLP